MIEINNLKKYFEIRESGSAFDIFRSSKKYIKAVNGVSFKLNRGQTIGVVGESGCGKTTLGRTIIRLLEPTGGSILFDGSDVSSFSDKEMKTFRRKVQIIFQDPFSSLNPRKKIFSIVTEGLKIHNLAGKHQLRERAEYLLDVVGLSKEHLDRYPHEFSGGQRQRIGISRAISLEPELIICDEPVSSLDVSVQAQIVNLLLDLQEKFNLGYLFITHDLSVVRYISHKIAVMYAGKIVEFADTDELFACPVHPYTKLLLAALPEMKSDIATSMSDDDITSKYLKAKGGCEYYPRCPDKRLECQEGTPELRAVREGHEVACVNI